MKPELDELRQWAVKRSRHFIDKLEKAESADEIEGLMYTLMRIGEHSLEKARALNRD